MVFLPGRRKKTVFVCCLHSAEVCRWIYWGNSSSIDILCAYRKVSLYDHPVIIQAVSSQCVLPVLKKTSILSWWREVILKSNPVSILLQWRITFYVERPVVMEAVSPLSVSSPPLIYCYHSDILSGPRRLVSMDFLSYEYPVHAYNTTPVWISRHCPRNL